MSKNDARTEKSTQREPAGELYRQPELTRRGTVEELTSDVTSTGSGIPTDFSTEA